MAKKNKLNNKEIITHKKCKTCEELLPLDDFKINYGAKDGTYRGYVCINCINEKSKNTINNRTFDNYYLYKFLNDEDEVIYVGKTINLDRRIEVHKSSHTSNIEDFDIQVSKIEYVKFETQYKVSIYEIHYIAKYKPRYNIEFNSECGELFDLPELEWKPHYKKRDIAQFLRVKFGMSSKEANEFVEDEDKVIAMIRAEEEKYSIGEAKN